MWNIVEQFVEHCRLACIHIYDSTNGGQRAQPVRSCTACLVSLSDRIQERASRQPALMDSFAGSVGGGQTKAIREKLAEGRGRGVTPAFATCLNFPVLGHPSPSPPITDFVICCPAFTLYHLFRLSCLRFAFGLISC